MKCWRPRAAPLTLRPPQRRAGRTLHAVYCVHRDVLQKPRSMPNRRQNGETKKSEAFSLPRPLSLIQPDCPFAQPAPGLRVRFHRTFAVSGRLTKNQLNGQRHVPLMQEIGGIAREELRGLRPHFLERQANCRTDSLFRLGQPRGRTHAGMAPHRVSRPLLLCCRLIRGRSGLPGRPRA